MTSNQHTPSLASRVKPLLARLLLGATLPAAPGLAIFTDAAHAQPAPTASPAPVVSYEYNAQGEVHRIVRGPGNVNLSTHQIHDRLGRLWMSNDNGGGSTRFERGGRDEVLSITDPRWLTTSYARNGFGDVLTLTSPDTGTANLEHDTLGNLTRRVDSRGVNSVFTYDALGRLTRATHSAPGFADQVFNWNHDQTGPGYSFGIGRLTSTSYPGGSTRQAYDALGRLTSLVQTTDAAGSLPASPMVHGIAMAYDGAGNLTRLTYPSGRVMHIAYAGGRAVSVSVQAGSSIWPLMSNIVHEASPGSAGVPRSWLWHLSAGTQAHSRHFDTSGRMVRYPLGGAVRDIVFDEADRIKAYLHFTGQSLMPAPMLDQWFYYDALSRLAAVNTFVGNWTIAYDANGNRTSLTATGPQGGATTRQHTVSASSNRLLALTNDARTFGHDAAGNTVLDQDTTRALQAGYDLAGRLARMTVQQASGSTELSYAYNAWGQRVSKRSGPNSTASAGTIFVHSPAGQLLGEYSAATGAPLREYLWLGTMPIAVIADDLPGIAGAPPIFIVHADHLDTPRVLLDRSGAQRWSWVAEPFGNSTPIESPTGLAPVRMNLRMPGQYFDVETGLNQNWHREYDASVGRYTQSDPIGLAGGINTYSYVGSAPTMYADPEGLQARPKPVVPRPPSPAWNPWLDRPAANEPMLGGGGGGGGGCECDKLKAVVDAMRSNWIRALISPTMLLPLKAQIYFQYRAAVALYVSQCGPYEPPRAPPEPPRDVIDDFYSR